MNSNFVGVHFLFRGKINLGWRFKLKGTMKTVWNALLRCWRAVSQASKSLNTLKDHSFLMKAGVGLVGFGNHHLKIAWPALSLPIFFHMLPSKEVIFSDDTPLQKKNPLLRFQLNILYYSPTSCYCTHYEDNIYNPYTTESCLSKNTNQN